MTDRIDCVWSPVFSTLRPMESARFMNVPIDGLWPSDHWGVVTTLD